MVFGSRVRRYKYPPRDRVCHTIIKEEYIPSDHEVHYFWRNETEKKIAMKPVSCWASCNRGEKVWDCWLKWYPQHKCKYRLTLPKE